MVYCEVVHDDADIIEEVFGPQLVKIDFKLLSVYRLAKTHH